MRLSCNIFFSEELLLSSHISLFLLFFNFYSNQLRSQQNVAPRPSACHDRKISLTLINKKKRGELNYPPQFSFTFCPPLPAQELLVEYYSSMDVVFFIFFLMLTSNKLVACSRTSNSSGRMAFLLINVCVSSVPRSRSVLYSCRPYSPLSVDCQ